MSHLAVVVVMIIIAVGWDPSPEHGHDPDERPC